MLRITISKSGQPPTTTSYDKREITIGRTPSNDVRIPEPGVSSSHARILYTDGTLTLVDLSSTNGTFVNGTRIQGPHMVQPGDEVYVCSHKLEFELAGADAPAPNGGPPLPVGVSSGPAAPGPSAPPAPPAPMTGGPPLPPQPVGGPPQAPGAPPPLGPPPPAIGAPPPPIAAAPPPSIPPSPRMDPSLPPPLGGPAAVPSLAVPSPVGAGASAKGPDMPTLPPMLGGGPSTDPPSSPPPVAASTPSEPPPAAPAPPVAVAPPAPLAVEPPEPEPEEPPLPAPAPPKPAAPIDVAPPAPAEPPAPPPKPDPAPPSLEPANPGPITPSTSAPSAKGELDSPQDEPSHDDAPSPKVVLGSKSPIRTGGTVMADHEALPRDPAPPPQAPPRSSWSMPHVGPAEAPPTAVSGSSTALAAPTPPHLHPAALAGLSRDGQTREACRQVFALVRDAWLADSTLDDDAIMARLRGGLEDLKATVGHLEPMSLAAQMQTELCGVGPLDSLLRDTQIQEVLLQGPTRTKVVKSGQAAAAHDASFTSDEALAWVISRLTGAPFGPENPVLEATTGDGHRVHAIHHSLAVEGPVVSIRRAQVAQPRYDLGQLTASAMVSDTMAKVLGGAVAAGLGVAIFAGPGANAFPIAAALALAAPASQRLVVVRPDHEAAQLPPDTVILQSTRPAAMPGLVEAALGLSPARLLVHDIAGEEASVALAALGRGLQGVILTSRASTADEGLERLASLSGLRGGHSSAQTRSLRVAVSLDLLLVVHRFGDGITRVTQLATAGVSPSGTPQVSDLVNLDPHTRNWTHTAALQTFVAELEQRGISVSVT